MNAAADIVVRALVVIFALAAGAFLEDIVAGELGSRLALGGRILAVLVVVAWAFLDGRATRDLKSVALQWLAVAVVVGISAGLVLKVVEDRAGSAGTAGWLGLAVVPFVSTLVPALAAAALGYALRGRLRGGTTGDAHPVE